MANMMPHAPREFDPLSREGEMFAALSQLPDDYSVLHSFHIVVRQGQTIRESETDFIVFHPIKGILCIEAKAGKVFCRNAIWYYGSGREMPHGGPYHQVNRNKWALSKYMQNHGMQDICRKIRIQQAVWFPSISDQDLQGISFPPDAERSLTMTASDLLDPQRAIDRILSLHQGNATNQPLTEQESRRVLYDALCPSLQLIPSLAADREASHARFHRLIQEQSRLLDYLEDQSTAVINGAAGTGKTMIAEEKARRHATKGERVLFLCFNSFLRDHLAAVHPNPYIDYFTIDKYACSECRTPLADFQLLRQVIENEYVNMTFPYKHIIIDEGQDFGQDRIEESGLIELLESIVLDEAYNGTFYLFYDRNQMVQSRSVPSYIANADCRLTLYRNCRNTDNIARTTSRLLGQQINPKMLEGSVRGVLPEGYIVQDESAELERLNIAIDRIKDIGISDIVILTCKTESSSFLSGSKSSGRYRGLLFTTVRKFKGLEADAVILIDIDQSAFERDNVRLLYVGASRARLHLVCICKLDDQECRAICETFAFSPQTRNPKKALMASFSVFYTQ